MKLFSTACLFAASIVAGTPARANVSLPKVFSSHMVLQRDMPIHVWGEATPGERVSIELSGPALTGPKAIGPAKAGSSAAGTSSTATSSIASSSAGTADKFGRWSVYLPFRQAGGPFTLTVHGTNSVQLDDILIGDLWLASGQSNMEMPLAGFNRATPIKDGDKEVAAANYPQIRLLHVEKDSAEYPLDDLKAATGWSLCTPDSARRFSAVAYFFARALQQKEHVPIGLVDSTWGGTPAEAWTSLDALSADASLMPVFSARATRVDRQAAEQRLERIDTDAKAQGRPVAPRGWHPDPASWRPAGLYNAMIAPLTPLPIRGVIWYQGESNSGRQMVTSYSRLFPALIEDWRSQWHQASLPFLFVQISAFAAGPSDDWGTLRDAQRRTLRLVNTGMAVTIDVGEEHNIHPANKQAVGERLALLARNIAYKENIVASGPLFRYAYPQQGAMHVMFENAAGLKSSGGPPRGFEVAGQDGIFASAAATIEGDTISLTSPNVAEPQYVRYAWPNYSPAEHQPNVYNAAGLPASPFTSYPVN